MSLAGSKELVPRQERVQEGASQLPMKELQVNHANHANLSGQTLCKPQSPLLASVVLVTLQRSL